MRHWSRERLLFLLKKAKIGFFTNRLKDLTDDQWNELGDWAYYRATGEQDPFPKRPTPQCLKAIANDHTFKLFFPTQRSATTF